jgi:hypothetical protein
MMPYSYEAALTSTNPHLGVRFDTTGRFLPEAGNTVVAQVAPGSPTEAALTGLRAALLALPEAGHFAFTNPASWHMTVFEGVIETRRMAEFWPEGLAPDLPIDTVTDRMIDRLAGWQAPPDFAMRITAVTPFGLRLTGATPADETVARDWRDRLSATFGLHRPGHETYGFHITLAYAVTPLPAGALPDLRRAMDDLTRQMQAAVPVLDLARPAFCRFADMNAFPPVHPL